MFTKLKNYNFMSKKYYTTSKYVNQFNNLANFQNRNASRNKAITNIII